jgi:uncharacterized protein (DUF39 family)
MVGTATIFVMVASLALLTFHHAIPLKAAATLTVFDAPTVTARRGPAAGSCAA